MSDLHRRTSHSLHSTEVSEPSDRSTPQLAMASSVDDERPTPVDVQRLSTIWENHGTIHVMGDSTNQSETTVPDPTPDPTSIEPPSPSSSSTEVDEKFEAGGRSDKASATASVTEIEDINNSRPPEPPYHVFTKKEKWLVTVIIAVAGLFSPLSSNIYFPALGAIANVSQKHPQDVFQGVNNIANALAGCSYRYRACILDCNHLHGSASVRTIILGSPQ